MPLDKAIADALRATTTGTIHTVLLKKGIRRTWMRGPRPLFNAGERVVGPAFTLRFVPVREDLATPESWSSPRSTRGAIEDMPEGCIAVGDAMGVTDAGIFGDILCARMRKRGVTALITDGVMRDGVGVASTGLPVWCAGVRHRPHLRWLAGADRLRRHGGVPGRHRRRGRRRRDRHSEGARRGGGEGRARAGAARGLDHEASREGRAPAGPVSSERRDQGALRGRDTQGLSRA